MLMCPAAAIAVCGLHGGNAMLIYATDEALLIVFVAVAASSLLVLAVGTDSRCLCASNTCASPVCARTLPWHKQSSTTITKDACFNTREA
jgi:hypothetical protein